MRIFQKSAVLMLTAMILIVGCSENDEAANQIEQMQRLSEQNSKLARENAMLAKKMDELALAVKDEEDHANTVEQLARLSAERDSARTKLASLNEYITDTEREVSSLEDSLEILAEKKAYLVQLQSNANRKLSKGVSEIDAALIRLETEKSALTKEIDQSRELIGISDLKVDALNTEIAIRVKQLSKLRRELASLAQLTSAEKTIDSLKGLVTIEEARVERYSVAIDDAETGITVLNDEIGSLSSGISSRYEDNRSIEGFTLDELQATAQNEKRLSTEFDIAKSKLNVLVAERRQIVADSERIAANIELLNSEDPAVNELRGDPTGVEPASVSMNHVADSGPSRGSSTSPETDEMRGEGGMSGTAIALIASAFIILIVTGLYLIGRKSAQVPETH